MPERPPTTRLSELKEQLRGAQEIQLDDAPRFSLESTPEKEVKPIAIAPQEQIRYRENDAFAEAVYNDLHWLLERTGTISVDEFEQRAKVTEESLAPAQRETFSRIRDRMKSAIEGAAQIDQSTIEAVIKQAQEMRYLWKKDRSPTIEISPWGTIVLSVQEEDWASPTDRLSQHTYGSKITEVSQQWGWGDVDTKLAELLERTIVLRTTDNEKLNAKVKKHELFHDIYDLAIAPEQPIRYDDPMEKKLFAQIKNEILAYLTEGKWRYNLHSLSLEVRKHDLKGEKTHYGNFMDLWGLVVRSLQERIEKSKPRPAEEQYAWDADVDFSYKPSQAYKGTAPEAIEEADNFTDHVWLLMREMARLYYLRAPTKEGIKAVLTAQDAKEGMYKLRLIGDRERISGETLWQVVRHERKERDYQSDELFAEQVEHFVDVLDHYQLPRVKNYEKFLDSLGEYIQTLKSQEVAAEMKTGHESRIRNLEEVLASLRERESPPPAPPVQSEQAGKKERD